MKIYIFKFGASGLVNFHKKENPITAATRTVIFLRKDRPMLVNHAKVVRLAEKRFETPNARTDIAGWQQWTAVSLLLELVGTVSAYVAKICNASQRGKRTYVNFKMTRSLFQVLHFEPTCARNTRCHITCFGAQGDQKVTIHEKQQINVAGQGQPKHLNIKLHGQYQALTG